MKWKENSNQLQPDKPLPESEYRELIYTARDSKIGSGGVGQPLNLCPACIAKLVKFSCFGDGKAWLKFRAPPCHIPIFESLSVYAQRA